MAWAYGHGQVEDVETMRGTCILAALNVQTMRLNEKVKKFIDCLQNLDPRDAPRPARPLQEHRQKLGEG